MVPGKKTRALFFMDQIELDEKRADRVIKKMDSRVARETKRNGGERVEEMKGRKE